MASDATGLPVWLKMRDDGVVVSVKAVPRARRTHVVGLQDGAVRIQIAAAPHKGQSNAALCAYLADVAGVRPNAVRVGRGSSGARKLVEVTGTPEVVAANLVARIVPLLEEA